MGRDTSNVLDADAILELIRGRGRRGMTAAQLTGEAVDRWDLDRSSARRALRPILRELDRGGAVVLGRGKRYFALEHSDVRVGRLKTSPEGLVFLEPEDRPQMRVAIPRGGRRGALDGDRVMVRLERPRKHSRRQGVQEGVVVRVLERRHRTAVGRWVAEGGRSHIRPMNKGFGIPVYAVGSRVEGEPLPGELVVMSVDEVDRGGSRARGTLLERLGMVGERPGVEDFAILHLLEIPIEFTAAALAEAGELREAGEAELAGRWDLRDRPAITIDGADARDFDDAVSGRPGESGAIEVEVHIADVGHYVRPGSALDLAARERGTSVYLPGRCVPMLPERVSNDLCCLREGVDRLARTVRFLVDREGRLGGAAIHTSVIRSVRRCTYDEVFEWLETPHVTWPAETEAFTDSLRLLAEAARRLGRRRHERGSLDFDLEDPRLVLDAEGWAVGVEVRERNLAHRLIEELMVAANECVARTLLAAGRPALHRVHEAPNPERIDALRQVLAELGRNLGGTEEGVRPAQLQRVLEEVEGAADRRLLSTLVLRSLPRALYSPESGGHFGLALDAYAHFTSPIRRYPDLICHRMLHRLQVEGGALEPSQQAGIEAGMGALAASCSDLERRADQAERMAVQWKQVLLMRGREGEVFDAHVAGVVEFGLFVQLDDLLVEGLVHVSDLGDDYYQLDERRHQLTGVHSGRSVRLGDPMQVRLARVDLDAMRLDFVPAADQDRRR